MLITEPQRLNAFFSWRETSLTIGTATTQLVPSDQSRVGMVVSANATGNLFITTRATASTSNGIPVLLGQKPLELSYSLYGGMLAAQWNVAGSVAGVQANVVEIFYRPALGRLNGLRQIEHWSEIYANR